MNYNVDVSKLNMYIGKILPGSKVELKLMKFYSRSKLSDLLNAFLINVEKKDSVINYNYLISFITDLELLIHNGIYKDLIYKEIKDLKVVNVYNKDRKIILTVELVEW